MAHTQFDTLEPPRFLTGKPILIAGLRELYTIENSTGAPAQWQRFMPFMALMTRQVGGIAYGVRCYSGNAGAFDYVTGVEVPDFDGLPEELARLELPEQRYAVFEHRDRQTGIGRTIDAILSGWLPQSGHALAGDALLERYDSSFEARLNSGGMEVWAPVKDDLSRT